MEALKDVELAFRYVGHVWSAFDNLEPQSPDLRCCVSVSGRITVEKISGFLLCLLSPAWRAKLCGEFSKTRRFEMEKDEAETLKTVVTLGCGGGGETDPGADGEREDGVEAERA
jgi:hypothetical protein